MTRRLTTLPTVSDFTVDRAQLDAGAVSFDQLVTSLQGITTTLQGMNLGDSDFGRVPWISTKTAEAYADHRQACIESSQEMKACAQSASDTLTATSTVYREQDEAAEEAAELIIGFIQAGPQ